MLGLAEGDAEGGEHLGLEEVFWVLNLGAHGHPPGRRVEAGVHGCDAGGEGAPGQLVISDAVAQKCRGKFDGLERRVVALRGKEERLGIRLLNVGSAA